MEPIKGPRVFFDVDDTIVEWEPLTDIQQTIGGTVIKILNPDSKLVYTRVIRETVNCIKRHKLQGHHITVFSKAGWEWAKCVIEALDLDKYVDHVSDKPFLAYDDKPLNDLATRLDMRPEHQKG